MTALATNRVPPRFEVWHQRRVPLGASAGKTYSGGLACVDTSDGYFKNGATSTTLRAIGIWTESVDNSAGSAGALLANVELFHPIVGRWMINDGGGGAIAQANVGSVCYVKDDQTVTITSTGASKAGIVWAVATLDGVSQVFVEFPYPAIAG
jgi:hypothetical protein